MAVLEQIVAGKSVAQLNAMAEELETMADIKAAAAAKAAAATKMTAVKGTGAVGAAAKTAAAKGTGTASAKAASAVAGNSATAVGVSAKSGAAKSFLFANGPGTIWSGNGLSLGLGLGLGAWGPVLLVAGGFAGWCAYKKYSKHYKTTVLDEPSI